MTLLAPKIAPAADTLGVIGLPAPIKELAARTWDAIVVGGGHNGLTCAAYLARAGKSVAWTVRKISATRAASCSGEAVVASGRRSAPR